VGEDRRLLWPERVSLADDAVDQLVYGLRRWIRRR
jgi:hypothetical protein